MRFVKAQATGNDFIIIDNRKKTPFPSTPESVQRLCERKNSIGADGVIVIDKHLRLKFYNSDGSRACFCGNGARCAALYLSKLEQFFSNPDETQKEIELATDIGIIPAFITDTKVRIGMPSPKGIRLSQKLQMSDTRSQKPETRKNQTSNIRHPTSIHYHFAKIGVPHIVIFVKDVEKVNVADLGKDLCSHPEFGIEGTNVNFAQIRKGNSINLRTFERGVEAETLSCGTGASATAIAAYLEEKLVSPVKVSTKGGMLKVYIGSIDEVYLEGPASIVYEGDIVEKSNIKY